MENPPVSANEAPDGDTVRQLIDHVQSFVDACHKNEKAFTDGTTAAKEFELEDKCQGYNLLRSEVNFISDIAAKLEKVYQEIITDFSEATQDRSVAEKVKGQYFICRAAYNKFLKANGEYRDAVVGLFDRSLGMLVDSNDFLALGVKLVEDMRKEGVPEEEIAAEAKAAGIKYYPPKEAREAEPTPMEVDESEEYFTSETEETEETGED